MDGRLRCMTAVYISRGEEMLLLYRVGSRVVEPSYCGIGGHFENEELNDARACALRELYEETGLRESDLVGFRMRYGCMRLKNGEIRQNYYFFAELSPQAALPRSCAEGRLEWVKYADLLKKDMPHSAYYVIEHYLRTGRYTECLYAGAATQDGMTFTALCEF